MVISTPGGGVTGEHCKRLRPIDYTTLVFIVINILFILSGWKHILDPHNLAVGYAACLVVTIAFIAIGGPEGFPEPASRGKRLVRWMRGLLREAYPLAFLPYFFVAVTSFDTVIFGTDLDPWFIELETYLFGSVPSSWLMVKFDSFVVSELLHGSYVLYYATIPALALWLYARNRAALPEYVTVAMSLFYVTCLVYIILPVVGGRFDPVTKAMTEVY